MSRQFYLRHDGFDLPIMPGSSVLGRANDCQVVLLSGRVSRRHAMLTLTDAGLSIQDLESANGVFVNGYRITKRTKLSPGDQVMLGDELLTVIPGRPRLDDVFRATLPGVQRDTQPGTASVQLRTASPVIRKDSGASMPDKTVRADILSLIATVAEKMLALGKTKEAERVLSPRLKEILSHAHNDVTVPDDVAESAARYAINLAKAAKDPAWVEYAFELHACIRQPLPSDVIELLYTVLRTIPPIQLDVLRRYIDVLDEAAGGFPPGQRFLVKRIRGLEGLAAAR